MFLLEVLTGIVFVLGAVFVFNRYIRTAFPSRGGITDAERGLSEAQAELEKTLIQQKAKEIHEAAERVGQHPGTTPNA